MMRFILLFCGLLLLSGCKVQLITQVKESDFKKANTNIKAALRVEVAACSDYENSKKDSTSVARAKESIPKLFPDAEFIECVREKMDSWAQFSTNIALINGTPSGDSVSLYRTANDFLGFYFPTSLNERLERSEEESFSRFNVSFIVRYVNDTDEDLNLVIDNLYVSEEDVMVAYLDEPATVMAGETLDIQSSDILISYLRDRQMRGAIRSLSQKTSQADSPKINTPEKITSDQPVPIEEGQEEASLNESFEKPTWCANAESVPEKLVCSTPELAGNDLRLNNAFDAYQSTHMEDEIKEKRAVLTKWNSDIFQKCTTVSCIKAAQESLLLSTFPSSESFEKPTWCANAESVPEKLVCDTAELASGNLRLRSAFDVYKSTHTEDEIKEKRAVLAKWNSDILQKCTTVSCIKAAQESILLSTFP